jgi:hypothetical protein
LPDKKFWPKLLKSKKKSRKNRLKKIDWKLIQSTLLRITTLNRTKKTKKVHLKKK